jgi:hypothetical protein
MKRFRSKLLSALLAGALFFSLSPLASADTPNFPPGSTCPMVLPFHISGQYTASATGVVRFKMPFPATLVTVMASARASGGTSPTLTVDVKKGGTTMLSSPVSVTAGSVSEATIADSSIADEAVITVDLTIGGTSPTWNDITIAMVFCRL